MCNRQCFCCDGLVFAGTITCGDTMVISFPSQPITNSEELCFIITSNIPSTTEHLPVVLSIGNTQFKWINKCGNFVYSDQIKTRKVYKVSLKTDSLLAVNSKCNLGCTSVTIHNLEPTAPTPAIRRGEEK